jgi:cation transport protein ChaC
MSHRTYRPRLLRVATAHGRPRALAFVADPAHPNYAGRLTETEVAARIVNCRGARGPNIDYLTNTLRHLQQVGVRDLRLHRIYARTLTLAGMRVPLMEKRDESVPGRSREFPGGGSSRAP